MTSISLYIDRFWTTKLRRFNKFNEIKAASSAEKRLTFLAISSILANNFYLLAFIAYFRSFQEINLAFETFFVKFLSIFATSSTLNVRTNEFGQYFNCIHKHRSRFCQVVPLLVKVKPIDFFVVSWPESITQSNDALM